MSFHYVDRIYALEPGKRIRGLKNVTRTESFFYWLPDGRRVLSPAVVTEALAQLGGWLVMSTSNFTRRGVLLGDEKTVYAGEPEAGDQLDLDVEVLDLHDDVMVTRAVASVRGKPMLIGESSRGYLMPLEDFDDPGLMRREFTRLMRPDLEGVQRVGEGATRLKPAAGPRVFEQLSFIDGIVEHAPYERVVGFKNFTATEPYFATHFPRKPCVPGVLLLTFMGEICQYLVKDRLDMAPRHRAMVPKFVQNVRFRKFVEPGDQCVLEAKVVSGDPRVHGNDVLVRATMFANGTRVMQADMGLRTMFAAAAAIGSPRRAG
jgi:3-hydroxymyristoyl/3-hydroxydecanoyl-(acyl carrier protein) dehydratase